MRSIRGRLLVMLTIGLAVVLLIGGTAVYWVAERNLVRQFDADLESRAHTIASLVKFEPGRLVFESGDAPAAVIDSTRFELRDSTGAVLKHSPGLAETPLPARAPSEGETLHEDVGLPDGTSARAVWLAFRPRMDPDDWQWHDGDETEAELLVVTAAVARAPIDRALATLLGALVVVGGVLGVTVIVLVTAGVHWGLAPLGRLTRQLGHVDTDTISTRFDGVRAPSELAPIYRELNRMLDRVEAMLDRERSFADAAAHELRTPLAELRSTAEVAIRWPDAERASTALREVLAIGREMEHLVESLLLISRGHAAAIDEANREVALAPIVEGSLDRATEPIRDKHLELNVALNGLSMPAPREALEIIIRNLVDNAVHYTPSGGHIGIRSVTDNGSMALIVENDPVRLAEEDLERLFEPFWQAERSRSDRTHAGLGLAVVQQIARASGLRVNAGLEGDRLRISVSPVEH